MKGKKRYWTKGQINNYSLDLDLDLDLGLENFVVYKLVLHLFLNIEQKKLIPSVQGWVQKLKIKK